MIGTVTSSDTLMDEALLLMDLVGLCRLSLDVVSQEDSWVMV